MEEMKKMVKINVHNVPAYALKAPYWVCRLSEGELWFWGAWNTNDEAQKIAREIGGTVVSND